MKGLDIIPSESPLIEAYNLLQAHHEPVSLEQIIFWGQWARFDPRLAEILIERLCDNWKEINPFEFQQKLLNQVWPQAIAPLIEHIELLLKSSEISRFRIWKKMSLYQIPPAKGEIYWIGVYTFAGKTMRQLPSRSLLPFTRWGFYADDILLNKARSRKLSRTILPKKQRLEILYQLARQKKFFRSINTSKL